MIGDEPSTVVGVGRETAGHPESAQSRLALRIAWHRDVGRVGDLGVLAAERSEISRKSPPFDLANDVVLSRDPFLTVLDHRGGPVEIQPQQTRMPIDVNGRPFTQALTFSANEVSAGVMILLAHEIVVCLHRIEVPVQRGPSLGLVGDSDAIERVRRRILSVADLDTTTLVRGATGTGKELVALAVRSLSKRSAGPFVKISLADIPGQTAASALFGHERGAFTGAAQAHPGLFVQADGGTMFLDEIALAAPEVQNMLLRVLETGEVRALGSGRPRAVDVRVIAATDEKLETAVEERRFSEPLLYRLNGYEIRLPALRDRREDIGPLLLHFLRQELSAIGASDQLATRDLPERPWLEGADFAKIAQGELRGNVRELRNLAKDLVISSRGSRHTRLEDAMARLTPAREPSRPAAPLSSPSSPRGTVDDAQIEAALAGNDFNFAAAARQLGIHRATLYERLRKMPSAVRDPSTLTDHDILSSHQRHSGDVSAMAAELRVSRKRIAALLKQALSRRSRP
jgi:two-component system nitrogen regulation response regulator GlnG